MKGTIRPRGPGKWQISVEAGKGPDGKRFRKAETVTGTKAAANKRLRELLTTLDQGGVRGRRGTTLGEWLEEWVQFKIVNDGIRAATVEKYRRDIRNHIVPAPGRGGPYPAGRPGEFRLSRRVSSGRSLPAAPVS